MSLAAFQQALTAMTLDAALAASVRRQGDPALAAWALTPLEQRRLVAVSRQPGMALNCTLARANRFAAVHDAFAMTCVLLGPALRGLLDDLWSSRRPDNVQLGGDVERFAERVQGWLDRCDAEDPAAPAPLLTAARRCQLHDVLVYEYTAYSLALSVRHTPDPEHLCSAPQWVDFSHDPQPLFEALQHFEQPPADLQRAPHRVRLALVDGELETAVFEVQRATQSLPI